MKKLVAALAICCAMPASAEIVTLNYSGSYYGYQANGFEYNLSDFQKSYANSFNNGVPYSFTFSYDTNAANVGGKFAVSFSEMLIGGVNKTADFTSYIYFQQAGEYTYMNVQLAKTETIGISTFRTYATFNIGDKTDIAFNVLPNITDLSIYTFKNASFDAYGRDGAYRNAYSSDSRGVSIVPPGSGEPGVVPVPEPASWAMMIGGFALLGGVLRRRTAAKAAFA